MECCFWSILFFFLIHFFKCHWQELLSAVLTTSLSHLCKQPPNCRLLTTMLVNRINLIHYQGLMMAKTQQVCTESITKVLVSTWVHMMVTALFQVVSWAHLRNDKVGVVKEREGTGWLTERAWRQRGCRSLCSCWCCRSASLWPLHCVQLST